MLDSHHHITTIVIIIIKKRFFTYPLMCLRKCVLTGTNLLDVLMTLTVDIS